MQYMNRDRRYATVVDGGISTWRDWMSKLEPFWAGGIACSRSTRESIANLSIRISAPSSPAYKACLIKVVSRAALAWAFEQANYSRT